MHPDGSRGTCDAVVLAQLRMSDRCCPGGRPHWSDRRLCHLDLCCPPVGQSRYDRVCHTAGGAALDLLGIEWLGVKGLDAESRGSCTRSWRRQSIRDRTGNVARRHSGTPSQSGMLAGAASNSIRDPTALTRPTSQDSFVAFLTGRLRQRLYCDRLHRSDVSTRSAERRPRVDTDSEPSQPQVNL